MKYKIRKDLIINIGPNILYKIEALKDFSDVKKGDLGGYVESEFTLSQEGNCWIYENSQVYDYSYVYGDAKVFGEARVSGRARLSNSMVVTTNRCLVHILGFKYDITLTLTGINIGCKYYKDLNDFMSRVEEEADNNGYTEIEKKHLIKLINMNVDYLNEIRGQA